MRMKYIFYIKTSSTLFHKKITIRFYNLEIFTIFVKQFFTLKKAYFISALSLLFCFVIFSFKQNDWGFFGHRKINRMAVFTLPQDLLPLYKKYITYLEEHSVDPDKRRYATKHEAVRHYIDLDQWGTMPFNDLPREFPEAIAQFSKIYILRNKDTILINRYQGADKKRTHFIYEKDTISSPTTKAFNNYFAHYVMHQYYEDDWLIDVDTFNNYFKTHLKGQHILIKDGFSEHGIIPYYLPTAMMKLTKAFEERNLEKILRQSAEIGHYIGDAHVPLHTTKNYNGQLTDQVGIHAFWESRLPELFSEEEYDFFVGKAQFIEKPKEYFWDIVFKSHSHLNEVLNLEKDLSKTYASDQQWCYDERLGKSIKIQCKEYSKAYHEAMKGMVEDRMTSAILSVGSIWYTAWVNGGQPNVQDILKQNKDFKLEEEEIKIDPKIKSRDHEN